MKIKNEELLHASQALTDSNKKLEHILQVVDVERARVTSIIENTEDSFLAFMRLVGCTYFSKFISAFRPSVDSPEQLYKIHYNPGLDQITNHKNWLNRIRVASHNRGESEESFLPTTDALSFHWLRACWTVKCWSQTDQPNMVYPSLVDHGWQVSDDGHVSVTWDTSVNLLQVEARIKLWSRGCSCKAGCHPGSMCGCVRSSKPCGPGCKCGDTCRNPMANKGNEGLAELLDVIIRDGGFGEQLA